ncbi:Ankyrin repeat and BTB/POZ domain-containing protein 1 [Acropora cervicornis]|uniref:Ankyrin repeat and BTB/POZ domain-containing protein 1 n=1 Tax=Acropora cervicornis TaxID=6130 RepID=A0AAD9UY68_ACRCE|nr:Ankyrin repeat and BTB/POZ domain-containing protein 1 [Acropora cervicornis]
MSNAAALFCSCRGGDIDNVRNLVENGEAELNLRDQWDSTPLYYACLCGHEDLVKYLLNNGARCAPNTFDGERCLYAALTDRIKNILRSYKAITPECMRRDSYREFFRRKWRDRSVIELKHRLVRPWAFNAILQYLYTDRLYIAMDQIDDCLRLAKHCKLEYLENQLQMRLNSIQMFGTSKKRSITVVSIEPESQSTSLQDAFGRLAEIALPSPFTAQQFPKPFPFEISLDLFEVVPSSEDPPPFFDVCFVVDSYRFHGHKVL